VNKHLYINDELVPERSIIMSFRNLPYKFMYLSSNETKVFAMPVDTEGHTNGFAREYFPHVFSGVIR